MNLARQIAQLSVSLLGVFFKTEAGCRLLKLASSGLMYEALDPDEMAFLAEQEKTCRLSQTWEAVIKCWLLKQFFYWPHQVPVSCPMGKIIARLPSDLLSPVMKLALRWPSIMREVGESDLYAEYLQYLVNEVYALLQANENSRKTAPWCLALASALVRDCSFIPLYFARTDMRKIAVRRAEIAELVLRAHGARLDNDNSPDLQKHQKSQKRLRVAFFIPVLTPRSETFVLVPLLKFLDRSLFSVTLYYVVLDKDEARQYFQSFVERIVALPEDVEGAIEAVRRDNQDMLIYATNLTVNATNPSVFMAAHRLAPIQVAETCSPVTTGLRNIDYYLSGTFTEPESAQQHYREKLLLVDGPAQAYEIFSVTGEENCSIPSLTLDALGIPPDSTVYVSGANFYKIIPELRELWAQILASVPDSYMILYPYNPNWSLRYPKSVFENCLQEAGKKYGVLADRWRIVGPFDSRDQLLGMIKSADVYLDSIRHSGAVSLLDPLKAGLPLVALEGRYGRGRQAAAILRSLGLGDYLCRNESEYVDLAVRLGLNRTFRRQYTDLIASVMDKSPDIFNGQLFAEKVGRVLLQVAEKRDLFSTDLNIKSVRLGSEYGGWNVVPDRIDSSSVIYSFGVGEDISFDIAIIEKFGSVVHAFDPTPRSIQWCKKQSLPSNFVLHEYGIVDFNGVVSFNPPENQNHISHTILDRPTTKNKAIKVPVKKITTIMEELKHDKIGLLKMDIEGAEYAVIDDMIASNIYPDQLLIEFHHRFPNVGIHKTKDAIKKIRSAGYKLFWVSSSGEEYGFIKQNG